MLTKNKKTCRLCQVKFATSRHHLIPKYVIKKIKAKGNLDNFIIYLCDDCHKEIHWSLFNHIIMQNKDSKEIDLWDAAKYSMLKDFLEKRFPEAEIQWEKYLKDFITNAIKEDMEDDDEQEHRNIKMGNGVKNEI